MTELWKITARHEVWTVIIGIVTGMLTIWTFYKDFLQGPDISLYSGDSIDLVKPYTCMIQENVSPDKSLTLIPNPPRPGLYVVLGSNDLIPWALQLITVNFSPKPIVWVDAANRFNAHWVAWNARSLYKDTNEVLRSYHIARPFTAYQLEAMVTQKLAEAASRHRALFSVIADPLSLYEGAEGRDTQVLQSFRRFMEGLRAAAARTPIVMLIPEPGAPRYFSTLVNAATSRMRMFESKDGRQLKEA